MLHHSRRIQSIMCAIGFAVAIPLALAQAPNTAPAAPEANDTKLDQAPARSILWPDFQVGQHVVLEMTYLDTKKSSKPVIATVTIDVVDKIDDVFIMRWKASNPRIPDDFKPMAIAAFHAVWDGTAGPTLDILVQEDSGVLGVQNWEAARDEGLASAKVALLKLRENDGTPVHPDKVDALLASFAAAALANEGAVDITLLRNVRAYFDGSYHTVAPGETQSEAIEIPWPFAGDAAMSLPMDRTTSLSVISTDPAPIYELSINLKPDDAKMKELMKAFTEQMADNLKGSQVDKVANSTIEHKIRWTFDTAKGWPTRASSTTRIVNGGDVTTQTTTYTLVEGPTIKARDPEAPTADPAQPNPAQQPPAATAPQSE